MGRDALARAERDCLELHAALTTAVRRLSAANGSTLDLLAVLERTARTTTPKEHPLMSTPTEADYLREIKDLLRAQISSLSSVALERTSKGTNVSVKVFATDPIEAARLAEQEYDRLFAKYDTGS
jgi:hypothetical protein